jgi:LmbE family N-acetylglucosaminyl deacetylase
VGEPLLVPIADTLAQRLEAIACYRSQVPVIFRFTQDFRRAVTSFAWEVGREVGPAERFWPVAR